MTRKARLTREQQSIIYAKQIKALRLRPWQDPPCYGDPKGSEPQDLLARRLLDAGLSQWEPDPEAALRAVSMKAAKP